MVSHMRASTVPDWNGCGEYIIIHFFIQLSCLYSAQTETMLGYHLQYSKYYRLLKQLHDTANFVSLHKIVTNHWTLYIVSNDC